MWEECGWNHRAPADKPETEKQKQLMQEDDEVEDEMVDVVVDEGEGRVPAVPEEEMFQDYLVRPTSIRRPREEDGEGRVPQEDGEGRVPEEDGEGRVPEEDELMEDQYHFATANSGPPSSWVQIHVFDEENADRFDSQATTRRLGSTSMTMREKISQCLLYQKMPPPPRRWKIQSSTRFCRK